MIITTTPSVEGRAIREYKGIAFGEVITGVNFMKDLGAGLRNFFGGRSAGMRKNFRKPEEKPWQSWSSVQVQWELMQ